MRILVVEDNEDAREYMRVLLASASHSVQFAVNGLEALKLLEGELPDLIISDLLMPEMDGFVFLKKIRSSERLCKIPFIVYTATYTSEQDKLLMEKIGASRFLIKPQEPEVLLAEITAVVEESRQIAESQLTQGKLANDYSNTLARKLDKKIRELQIAEQTKNNFISIMSHEIRTPLHGILGPVQLLERYEFPKETRRLFDIIQHSANDLLHVFEQLVEVVELQQERIQLLQQNFLLEDILVDLKWLFFSSAQEKQLEFQIHKLEHLPARLIGDPMRLKQILSNLLSNAIKFTDKGLVELSVKTLPQETGLARLEFTVRDTGRGIQPEQLDNIFDLFNVGGDINSRDFRGTGMGLLITKRLVEFMKGNIQVESQLDQGSRFRVELSFPLPAN